MNATLLKLREIKTDEQLAHLFIDKEDNVRDRHIEDMWNRLYGGKPLDAIFRTNFSVYHKYLTMHGDDVPPAVFDNVSEAQAWVAARYGLLHIRPFDPALFEYDEALAPMRYMARLRTRFAPGINEHCYSSTELGAILLTVVNVFRSMASEHLDQMVQ
jgi:hypothetical protein